MPSVSDSGQDSRSASTTEPTLGPLAPMAGGPPEPDTQDQSEGNPRILDLNVRISKSWRAGLCPMRTVEGIGSRHWREAPGIRKRPFVMRQRNCSYLGGSGAKLAVPMRRGPTPNTSPSKRRKTTAYCIEALRPLPTPLLQISLSSCPIAQNCCEGIPPFDSRWSSP